MINTLIELLASLIDSCLCIYFITAFCKRKIKETSLFFPAIIVYFGATLLCDKFLSGYNMVGTTVLFVLSIIYAFLICKKRYLRAVISTCIYKAALILLSSFLFMILSMIVENFELLMQGTHYIGRYVLLFLHKVFLYAVLMLALSFSGAYNRENRKAGLFTFLFTLITMAGLGATMYLTSFDGTDGTKTAITIIVFAFIISNVFLYIFVYQIIKNQHDLYEIKRLEDQLKFEEENFNNANAIWNQARQIQHDMKNHLAVITSYLKSGETNECVEYISELTETVEKAGTIVKSDNQILDFLINTKLAGLEKTQVIVSGSIGDLSDIKDSDLACIIGNILDNAVEAVSKIKDRRIELLFMRQNSNRVIVCKNTIEESVLKDNKELKSTKTTGSHGYGHLIVEQIVEKYHGIITYFEEDDMFGVQMIIPQI